MVYKLEQFTLKSPRLDSGETWVNHKTLYSWQHTRSYTDR